MNMKSKNFWSWFIYLRSNSKLKRMYSLVSDGFYDWLFFFFFLGPYLQHMEVPRLGVKSESQPQQNQIPAASAAYTAAHGNARSFNSLSKTRDQISIASTCILVVFLTLWTTTGAPIWWLLLVKIVIEFMFLIPFTLIA